MKKILKKETICLKIIKVTEKIKLMLEILIKERICPKLNKRILPKLK